MVNPIVNIYHICLSLNDDDDDDDNGLVKATWSFTPKHKGTHPFITTTEMPNSGTVTLPLLPSDTSSHSDFATSLVVYFFSFQDPIQADVLHSGAMSL